MSAKKVGLPEKQSHLFTVVRSFSGLVFLGDGELSRQKREFRQNGSNAILYHQFG